MSWNLVIFLFFVAVIRRRLKNGVHMPVWGVSTCTWKPSNFGNAVTVFLVRQHKFRDYPPHIQGGSWTESKRVFRSAPESYSKFLLDIAVFFLFFKCFPYVFHVHFRLTRSMQQKSFPSVLTILHFWIPCIMASFTQTTGIELLNVYHKPLETVDAVTISYSSKSVQPNMWLSQVQMLTYARSQKFFCLSVLSRSESWDFLILDQDSFSGTRYMWHVWRYQQARKPWHLVSDENVSRRLWHSSPGNLFGIELEVQPKASLLIISVQSGLSLST